MASDWAMSYTGCANLLDHAEQRFLEIARGLAMRPSFILLDEPAGGLTTQRD